MIISGVTLSTPANVYFNGKVISYTFRTRDGQRHEIGIIFPGSYLFDTKCLKKIQITSGTIHVYGVPDVDFDAFFGRGTEFEVPAFTQYRLLCDVPTEYICSCFE